jgi:hypothetical protein
VDALILSHALDTNGQNARYVRAAERWGTDPDVVRALAVGHYDPAAVVGRFQAAADRFGNLSIRSVHRATHLYQSMPADIVWTPSNEKMIRALAMEADVVHLNNSWRPWDRLRARRSKPPFLLHHHGSLFRSNPREMLDWAHRNGALQAVSTVDLQHAAPDRLHWLPTAYPVKDLEAFGAENRREPDGRVLVISAPTNREFKSTALLERAVADLVDQGLPIDLEIIENRPWAECMARKARADIYFDQVILGYGCNAVEAWAMDIPVIAGAGPWTTARMTELWGQVPYYTAHEDIGSIQEAIVALAASPKKRASWARRGKAHVLRYHDEKPALERLAELYGRAIAKKEEDLEYPEVVTASFTATIPTLRVGSQRLNFTNGPVTIENPYTANRLRHLALRHPDYGIREVA